VSVDVLTETVINRPPTEVAAFAGDPTNAPQWYVNIKSMDWRTPPPMGIGSRMAFVARFLGKTITYTYEITEFVPGERLVMRTAEGPFPMETTYTWAPTPDGGTHMSLRNRGKPSGFSTLIAPFMGRAVRAATTKDLAALKRILESRAT
jgi:uncharacterized protein YndB with AHSA1/START domain